MIAVALCASTAFALDASRDSFAKLSEQVATHPELGRRRLWIDTSKEILARGRKIVVPPSRAGSKQTVLIGW